MEIKNEMFQCWRWKKSLSLSFNQVYAFQNSNFIEDKKIMDQLVIFLCSLTAGVEFPL